MWPMSRRGFAKQFQPILGEESFLETTITRVKFGFKPEDIYFAVPKEQVHWVKKQAKGIPPENIIPEPERRDNLGAVGLATVFLDKYFPSSLMAVVWGADHLVKQPDEFNRLLKLAARVCQVKDVICKIDTKPPYIARTYGWVKLGKLIGRVDHHEVYDFEKFVEKPDLETIKKYFKDKHYLAQTGYFVWRTSTMIKMLKKYSPKNFRLLMQIRKALGTKKENEVLKQVYRKIEKISFEYGLLEKLPPKSMSVILADMGWFDVGTWDLLYEALAIGQRQNITRGEVEFIEAKGNLVYLPKNKVAAIIGLDNVVVVDTKDGLLVCRRGKSENIKKFIELLKKKGKVEYL